jgi:hypothetical protein
MGRYGFERFFYAVAKFGGFIYHGWFIASAVFIAIPRLFAVLRRMTVSNYDCVRRISQYCSSSEICPNILAKARVTK